MTREALAQQFLSAETRAWLELTPAEYDRTVRELFEQLAAGDRSPEQVDAALGLAGATLRRPADDLVESRAACSEHLLELSGSLPDPERRSRGLMLFLVGWFRLAAVAEKSPESIQVSPPLPAGVVLPTGADPSQITDPALREEAEALARDHRAEAERWNAGQTAIGHLRGLSAHVETSSALDARTASDLLLAMSLAAGLPPELRFGRQFDAS
jgi:hypothetical protein